MDTATHTHHLEELREQGYTLLPNRIESQRLRALQDALDRLYAAEAHLPRQRAEPGCLRGSNLVRRDPLFREALVEPEIVALAEALLGADCILHSFETRSALPNGGGMQSLHRDMPYADAVPLSMNVVWMLDDFTAENGATRVVPGSHRRPESPEPGRVYPDEVVAVAPAGSLLAFNSLTWHGGGPNHTSQLRRGFHVHYCRKWVRPHRDHPRSMDAASLEGASPLLIRLLGYHAQMEFEPTLNDHQYLPIPPAATTRGGKDAKSG
jgi:ectoine hydroxylase-related dioxygenase (phytanoyl-CoA dioxygenase family)